MQWPKLGTSTKEKGHLNPQQFDAFLTTPQAASGAVHWPDWKTKGA